MENKTPEELEVQAEFYNDLAKDEAMTKEKPLNEKEHYVDSSDLTEPHYYQKDVALAVKRTKERIRLAKNRDDKVKARIMILDHGGIGKQEVYNIIKEEFGEFK